MIKPDNQHFDHSKVNANIGVLVVNLGTPDAPTPSAVRRYLREFLSDPRVVSIPKAIWWFILNFIVLPIRGKRSAHAYQSIWTEQGSPLMVLSSSLTAKIANALQQTLPNSQVRLAMRYGQPAIATEIDALLAMGINKLVVLPLYPQYSGTTTASVFDAVSRHLQTKNYIPELRFINHYHDDPEYIDVLARSIADGWNTNDPDTKLLLSYHGIPKDYWLAGDPYPCHCYKTSRLLAESLGVDSDRILTTFQSRFGKQEWVKPYTDATLEQLPKQGVTKLAVACPAFAVDCLETLEEIKMENQQLFLASGGKAFDYIDCLNDSDQHAEVLAKVIVRHCQDW